jgi:sugar/nucleoside kinase (ribokinase family)
MNYWIQNKRASLVKLLKKVDIFFCNDAEVREFSGEYGLMAAAAWVLRQGPKLVIVKKGEHGVLCMTKKFLFTVPAYPIEKVFDPTGAGDSFAGGFMGYLTRDAKITPGTIRRATVYGSVIASFNVESFSLNRLAKLKRSEIESRYRHFRQLTKF